MYKIDDIVKIKNNDTLYIIKNIEDEYIYLNGYNTRQNIKVSNKDIILALEEDVKKTDYNDLIKTNKIIKDVNKQIRNTHKLLKGTILHIDGDKHFLEQCLKLYKEVGIYAYGMHIEEKDIFKIIKYIILDINPQIIVITGHDNLNGNDKNNLDQYENSSSFVKAIKKIRELKNIDDAIIIAGACSSHFEALIASGANFASSPKRINIHTFDPAIIAVKCATTSNNKMVDFDSTIKLIEHEKAAFGGVETKGKMKVMY